MEIVYKLLDNGNGIILTRSPETVQSTIFLRFEGAPEGSVAVFQFHNGREYYRDLEACECAIPFPTTSGEIKVSIVVPSDSAHLQRWICEELKYDSTPNGEFLVSPNDSNLPQEVTNLKLENEALRKGYRELIARISKLEKRLTNLMEGYDIV